MQDFVNIYLTANFLDQFVKLYQYNIEIGVVTNLFSVWSLKFKASTSIGGGGINL